MVENRRLLPAQKRPEQECPLLFNPFTYLTLLTHYPALLIPFRLFAFLAG
jgi:hypothetical protein